MRITKVTGAGSTPLDVKLELAQAIEVAPNGIALTDAAGRILLTNAELERMFGRLRTHLLGRHIEDLMAERFRLSHALLRTGEGKQDCLLGAGRELAGLRADGTEFPIEVGLSVLETQGGTALVETIVDISVRKRLERMFQKMVEMAPCGLVLIEPPGRILLANPQMEAMFGYIRGELIGASLERLLPERFHATHRSHCHAFAATPSIRPMGGGRDLMARRKDGTEFPVEVGLNPVPAQEGGLVLAAVSDITRRKHMELELLHANNNLEEFTDAASHELRSALRASSEVARNLGRANDRIRRLEQVIDDLLTYARAGATPAQAVTVDPHSLVAEILENQLLPPGFRVVVHVDVAPFVTSKAPLATALRNIIANAVKHHDLPNGNVEIRVEEAGRYYVFSVADDGPGIAPAGRGGSGIGLALSKRLVASHGGHISLDSTDGVRGATFRIWWPCRES